MVKELSRCTSSPLDTATAVGAAACDSYHGALYQLYDDTVRVLLLTVASHSRPDY